MVDPLKEEELVRALGKLRCGKASGEFNILREMVEAACCGEEFIEWLLELAKD